MQYQVQTSHLLHVIKMYVVVTLFLLTQLFVPQLDILPVLGRLTQRVLEELLITMVVQLLQVVMVSMTPQMLADLFQQFLLVHICQVKVSVNSVYLSEQLLPVQLLKSSVLARITLLVMFQGFSLFDLMGIVFLLRSLFSNVVTMEVMMNHSSKSWMSLTNFLKKWMMVLITVK
jgi:hypothetical protein